MPFRIVEEEIESAIDSRNEALATLRELGPPDLVHLVKQTVKSGGRQVRLHDSDDQSSGYTNIGGRMGYITTSQASTRLPQPASQPMSILLHMLRVTRPRKLFQAYTGLGPIEEPDKIPTDVLIAATMPSPGWICV